MVLREWGLAGSASTSTERGEGGAWSPTTGEGVSPEGAPHLHTGIYMWRMPKGRHGGSPWREKREMDHLERGLVEMGGRPFWMQ